MHAGTHADGRFCSKSARTVVRLCISLQHHARSEAFSRWAKQIDLRLRPSMPDTAHVPG